MKVEKQLVHELKPNDREKRVEFTGQQPQLLGDNPAYLRNIFVMDDAHFYLHGEEIHIGTTQAQALYTAQKSQLCAECFRSN
ncbi:hypothetical protein DdX_15811 [Ditylenchus destructor]|uniref:Uncharacterized protein n=1 Tax=Ditylenchus destructor TaxID=166010 RepID=A0AAD4R0I3_9BILA|nr:hypothetical protein DdX_15811 [Ditylenchus destructor]